MNLSLSVLRVERLPVLRNTYCQKIQEYHKKLIESLALVRIAKESMDSSKASQHLHKIHSSENSGSRYV